MVGIRHGRLLLGEEPLGVDQFVLGAELLHGGDAGVDEFQAAGGKDRCAWEIGEKPGQDGVDAAGQVASAVSRVRVIL